MSINCSNSKASEESAAILALDASTDACSVALLINDEVLERFVVSPQQHTKLLLPMISALLEEAGLDLKQLDAIAFGYGPGSFTGIRLAASLTQGLAYAANIPVVRISTLCALAQAAWEEYEAKKVIVAQDARMQEIYLGKYQIGIDGYMQALEPDKLISPEAIQDELNISDFVGVGSGWSIYSDILNKNSSISVLKELLYPRAKYIAKLAMLDFARGMVVSAEEIEPKYLRNEVAWT